MRRFIPFFLALLLCFCVVGAAAAAEPPETDGDPSSDLGGDLDAAASDDLGTYVDSAVLSVSPVTPTDANGLKAVFLGLVGDYDAIVVEHRYQTSSGSYNYVREIQPDYVWIGSALCLLLVIFCIFKMGGAVLCRK